MGLGGTDCAAILGLNPWKTPIEVYEGKINPGATPELDKECLRWGNLLEPIVRTEYASRFGVEVASPFDVRLHFDNWRDWNGNTLVVGKEPWMLGAPDGWMPSIKSGLEVKTASRRSDEWGSKDGGEVPAHYLIQVAWYMAVTNAKGWDFAVLFSGNTLERFHVDRDPDFEANMVKIARDFWNDNVLKQVEPRIDQTESYGRYLARKFSLSTGQVITNPSQEILDYAAEMKAASEQKSVWEGREREANNHLRALIGEAQKAVTPLGTLGWVRPEKKDVTDWPAFAGELEGLYDNARSATAPSAADVQQQFTKEEQRAAYLRAWWKK